MMDIKYEIKEISGVLSESAKGWIKKLNLISWIDKEAKYDLRDWDPDNVRWEECYHFCIRVKKAGGYNK